MNRIQDLERLIPYYSQKYYEGNPEISDAEFDKLVDELRELDPSNTILYKTGWGYEIPEQDKVSHLCRPILGISTKFRSYAEAPDYFKSYTINLVTTPKLDGGSVVIYYKNGKFDRAISRGDGYSGVDISYTIRQLNSVPKVLADDSIAEQDLVVRGEIVIPINNSMDIVNVRNIAVGFSQRKRYDLTDVEKDEVLFIPYSILNLQTTPSQAMRILKWHGFIEVPQSWQSLTGLNSIFDDVKNKLSTLEYKGNTYTLPIDGLVIVEDRLPDLIPYEGKVETYLSELIAWKIDTEERETTVKGITWQLSAMGKYTPVMEISPVEIDGTTISRVTGNSIEFLEGNKCGVNSKITITKSGGVIPKLVSVLEPSEDYQTPSHCLKCSSSIERTGAHIFCSNPDCVTNKISILWNYFYAFRPKYGADALFLTFLDKINAKIDELDKFIEYMKQTFSYKMSESEITSIIQAYNLTDHQSKLLSQFIKNVTEYSPTYYDIYLKANIFGLGEVAAKEINNNYPNMGNQNSLVSANLVKYENNIKLSFELFTLFNQDVSKKIFEYKKVISSDLPKVCLTNLGGSPLTKSQIAEKLGHKYNFVDSVDKTVSKVVYCKPGSSKMKAAEKLGIEVVDVNSFLISEGINA